MDQAWDGIQFLKLSGHELNTEMTTLIIPTTDKIIY